MDSIEIVVLAAGVSLIAFVLWFFFGPRKRVRARAAATGVQEIEVTVKGGYSPDVIVVEKDRPVRLRFKREESASCSERVVFPDFGVARDLPAFKTTTIDLTPTEAGEFTFTCGMNMMRGKLIVERV